MKSMSIRKSLVALRAACLALVLPIAHAWAQAPQPPQAPQAAPQAPQTAPQAGKRPPQQSLPKSPQEREKILSDLYALLATAEDEHTAKAISEGIERVWMHSGSPTIDLLMERSMKAVAEKKHELALKLLDQAVDLAPDFTEAWNRRAYVYFLQNDVERALGDLRRTLALDPSHFKALEGLGQILREIGQKKAALKAFKQLIEVHPYWSGAQQAIDELVREVDGQGI